MASTDDTKQEPTSPTVLQQQYDTMFKTFQMMGLNPKGDTPEDFDQWIKDYTAQTRQKQETHGLTLPTDPPTSATGTIPKQRTYAMDTKPVVYTTSSQPPKLRSFSGGDNKGETPYDIWRYEVRMIQKDLSYSTTQKDLAIRRSLTGSAARMVMYQDHKTIDDLLATLDSVYGNVDNKEQILAEFYSARQKDDEDVTTWSNRLQEILGRAVEKQLIMPKEVNNMIHNMLYTGLRPELKDVSGHKFDTIKDFNKLRVALRQLERDHMPKKSTGKPNTVKAATSVEPTNVEQLMGMVSQLTHTVAELQRQQQNFSNSYRPNQTQGNYQPYHTQSSNQPNQRGNYNSGRGGYNRQPKQSLNWQPQQRSQPNYQNLPQSNQDWNNQQVFQPTNQPTQQQYQRPPRNQETVRCYRCGLEGHIQIGCRINLDHSQRDLNARKPLRRGR